MEVPFRLDANGLPLMALQRQLNDRLLVAAGSTEGLIKHSDELFHRPDRTAV
jgi:hypothetical protein